MVRLIAVAGPHRSGSSAGTRALGLLGVDIGRPDEHLPTHPANPLGFHEPRELVAIDDELLAALGGDWSHVPAPAVEWEWDEALEPLRARARRFVSAWESRGGTVGFKDPRLSITLPFWRTVREPDNVVMMLRAADASVQSLQRRDAMDEDEAARLWLRYTLETLDAAPDTVVLSYAQLLDDPESFAHDATRQLDLEPPGQQGLADLRAWARPDQDNSAPPTASPGHWLEIARELHEMLASGERPTDALWTDRLAELRWAGTADTTRWRTELLAGVDRSAVVAQARAEAQSATEQLVNVRRQLVEARAALERERGRVAELRQQAKTARSATRHAERRLEVARAERDELRALLARAEEERAPSRGTAFARLLERLRARTVGRRRAGSHPGRHAG